MLNRPLGVRLAWLSLVPALVALALIDQHLRNDISPQGIVSFEVCAYSSSCEAMLEACRSLPDGRAVIFGSGSAAARERLVLVQVDRAPRIKPAAEFSRALRSVRAFVGPALNLEGAVCDGERVRLFQRS